MSLVCPEPANNLSVRTSRGRVDLSGPVGSQSLKRLAIAESLTNFRPAERQKEALVKIAGLPEGMIYVAVHNDTIVGYVTLHRPHRYSRWFKHPRILEMGAIEIAPEWRRFKIAQNLLELAFSNPVLEEYIVITTEFYWHWDLARTRMDVWQYQNMLARLFGAVGMQKTATDDPAVLEHPANVLMVKFGKQVSMADRKLFAELQFLNQGSLSGSAAAGRRTSEAGAG